MVCAADGLAAARSRDTRRFKDPRPREFKVPLNFTIKGVEIPVGLGIILFILLMSAICNSRKSVQRSQPPAAETQ